MNRRNLILALFAASMALSSIGCSSDDSSSQRAPGEAEIQTNVPANRDPANSMGDGVRQIPLGSN